MSNKRKFYKAWKAEVRQQPYFARGISGCGPLLSQLTHTFTDWLARGGGRQQLGPGFLQLLGELPGPAARHSFSGSRQILQLLQLWGQECV